MKIVDLDDSECCDKDLLVSAHDLSRGEIARLDAKRALVGAGARILFYPTLLYNIVRNKVEPEFHWWDEIDQFLLLGAVPFPKDVPCLKQLGVQGVITLNEPYETLVPTSLYQDYGIDHLMIPTRDYLFAPSFLDISRAVDFIHENATCGKTTYVHCKAGRGRSTTIVLCYMVKYKHMMPAAALEYVRSRRPRVLLAPAQWQAVQDYCKYWMGSAAKQIELGKSTSVSTFMTSADKVLFSSSSSTLMAFADEVLITEADLEGYSTCEVRNDSSRELGIPCRAVRGRAMLTRLSCLFTSLKASGGSSSITGRLLEIRAC